MVILQVDEAFQEITPRDQLIRAATVALEACGEAEAALSVVVTDEETIRDLNKQHRGKDIPTDVLSFPADYVDPDLDRKYIGDVLISFPTARAQTEDRDHGVGEELQLLVVHGVLHLLGYDHVDRNDRDKMEPLQRQVLSSLDLDIKIEGW